MTDQREALLRLPRYAHPKGTMIRLDDVLAALPSTPQPEGLDVERLARATVTVDLGPDAAVMPQDIDAARTLAAEYARLAPPPPEPTADTEDDPEPEVHGEASMLRREYWKRRHSDD